MGLLTGDTYITQGKKESVPYCKEVTINEHRAPTDQSVKLLNEFEEKAKKNLIAKINIKDNQINLTAVYFVDDVIGDTVNFYIKFSLNGKEYNLEDKIYMSDWNAEMYKSTGWGSESVHRAFIKFLSTIIAAEFSKMVDFSKFNK